MEIVEGNRDGSVITLSKKSVLVHPRKEVKHMTNKKGFTLIELLVVIAIIGILSAIGLVSLGGAREKARDAQRKTDIATMRTAMQLYFDDHDSKYPSSGIASPFNGLTNITGNFTTAMGSSGGNYLPTIPTGPTGAATACAKAGNYYYASNSTGLATNDATHFILAAQLEGSGCKLVFAVSDTNATSSSGNAETTANNVDAAAMKCGAATDMCAGAIPNWP